MKALRISGLSLLFVGFVVAAPMDFSEADTNGDGFISKKELNTMRAAKMQKNYEAGKRMKNIGNASSFEEIDTNNDGKISKEELALMQNEKMKKRMEEKRKNKMMNKGQQGQRMGMGKGLSQ